MGVVDNNVGIDLSHLSSIVLHMVIKYIGNFSAVKAILVSWLVFKHYLLSETWSLSH